MRPCVGIVDVCPPLCKWSDLHDGTYNLADVERFNAVMDEMLDSKIQAMT
jgi:hypothetical protein